MRPCKHCGEDLDIGAPELNVALHVTGACLPSHREWGMAIEQLEIEDQHEKEAIRAFWERERQRRNTIRLRWDWLLGALAVGCILAVGLLYLMFRG